MRISLILLAALLGLPAAAPPMLSGRLSTAHPDQLVERARESLQAGDATRALALAQQAQRADIGLTAARLLRGKATTTVMAPAGPVVLELIDGEVPKAP